MTSTLEGGEWSAARPGRTLLTEKNPVPTLQEDGWAPGQVWTGGKYRPYRDFFFCKYKFIVPSVDKYNGYVGSSSVTWYIWKSVLECRIVTIVVLFLMAQSDCLLVWRRRLFVVSLQVWCRDAMFLSTVKCGIVSMWVLIRSRNVQPVVDRCTDWTTQPTL